MLAALFLLYIAYRFYTENFDPSPLGVTNQTVSADVSHYKSTNVPI